MIAIVGILASLFFCCGDSLPEKAPPSGDGSDSEGDLSGGAESSDTGSLQWDDSASAPYGGTGEFSDDQKQAKLGISVENTVLAEEKEGNIYAVLYVSEKQAGQPESEQRRVWR